MKPFVAIFCFGLTGCSGAIIMVNLGSTAHTAAAIGPQLPPEVECAALAQPKITGPIANIDAVETCLQAVQAQRALDKAKQK